MKYVKIFLFILLLIISHLTFSQKATILTKKDTVTTTIKGFNDDLVFTHDGNLKFEDIRGISFEEQKEGFEDIYAKLKAKVPINFEDNLDFPFKEDLVFTTKHPDYIDGLPINEKGIFEYIEVVQIPGATKDQLYKQAKIYFVESFRSANHVIQLDNKEDGMIIGKGEAEMLVISGITGFEGVMRFSIKIEVRPERYRLTIYDIGNEDRNMGSPYYGNQGTYDGYFLREKYYKKSGRVRELNLATKKEFLRVFESIVSQVHYKMSPQEIVKKEDW